MAVINGLLAAVALCSLSGVALSDVNVADYLFWKRSDIEAMHVFFPMRALQEENATMLAAIETVSEMADGLSESLNRVVTFQAKETVTARQLMAGTAAIGCLDGIADYMNSSIAEVIQNYLDCTADAVSKVIRLQGTWNRTKSAYLSAYQRAKNGIDVCAKTYPNNNQFNRLKSCVESIYNNYLRAAKKAQGSVFPSPSMSNVFMNGGVAICASTAAVDLSTRGKNYLGMMFKCSALDENIDPKQYKEQLDSWVGYEDNLLYQMKEAQNRNYDQIYAVENAMGDYYTQQKVPLQKSLVENRDNQYYQNKLFNIMSSYYNTLTGVALDNQGDEGCVNEARYKLDQIANKSVSDSLACDSDLVRRTRELIDDVLNKFMVVNKKMPDMGNVAILKCLAKGFIFAPNTITACFNQTYNAFDIDIKDRSNDIVNDTNTLFGFQTFFNSTGGLPCGGSSKERLLLACEGVLYDLQRCLYSKSGTVYDVTTPMPSTSVEPYTSTVSPYTSTTQTPV